MIFQLMKLGVIPRFRVILTGQFISNIIFMTQGHLQGQVRNMCNTAFSYRILT